MKKIYLKLFSLFFLIIFLFMPLMSLAQDSPGHTGQSTSGHTGFWGIENPLKADSFTELLENIIDWIIDIGILIAVIMIIYSGYLFMTSGGNEEKVSKAKKAFIWSLVGLAVLIMGKNFISLIKDILGVS